jgi:hypothetical protein
MQASTKAPTYNRGLSDNLGPSHPSYWTQPRLQRISEFIEENNMRFEEWEANSRSGEFRTATLSLVRKLKSLPEWEGLTPEQAAKAMDIAIHKLAIERTNDPGNWIGTPETFLNDDWSLMISVCGVNQLDPRDDFKKTWKGVRMAEDPQGRDPVTAAYELAEKAPVSTREEFEEQFGPCSKKFLIFLSLACYLQERVGPDGYILLPQEKIAKLMNVSQPQISYWSNQMRDAGCLEEIEAHVPMKKARRWHCKYVVNYRGEPTL